MEEKNLVCVNKPSPVTINEKRALLLFRALQSNWEEGTGIFEGVILPENRYVAPFEEKSFRRANQLFFFSITMRGAIVSDDPIRWLGCMHQLHPNLFEPKKIIQDWTVERICDAFRQATTKLLEAKGLGTGMGAMGLRYKEFAQAWLHNAGVLDSRWQGNVLNVFDGVKDFEEAFARVDYYRKELGKEKGFIGMRRKIFSLFTIWLQEYKIIPNFPVPLPVDFHALRTLQGTGVVKFLNTEPLVPNKKRGTEGWAKVPFFRASEKITDAIATWSQRFLIENGLSHEIINPAMWVLSRTLCSAHYQNKTIGRKKPIVWPKELKFRPELWPANYSDPCRHCPIENLCQYVSPSGPYYRWGYVVSLERIPYSIPVQAYFPGFDPGFQGRKRSHQK